MKFNKKTDTVLINCQLQSDFVTNVIITDYTIIDRKSQQSEYSFCIDTDSLIKVKLKELITNDDEDFTDTLVTNMNSVFNTDYFTPNTTVYIRYFKVISDKSIFLNDLKNTEII